MKKNKIKDMIDISKIILLIFAIILFEKSKYTISGALFILVIIISIIDIIFWRCPKCGNRLPMKSFVNIITYCPYCKSNIEGKKNI